MSAACVHVRLGVERYAVRVADVIEVAELKDPTPVPGAPPSILGVVNRHGLVLPVVGLGQLLGARSAMPPTCVLVVDDGGRRAGLAVDEVLDVGPMPPLTEDAESDLLAGAALLDGELVGLLDLGRLLDAAGSCGGARHGR